MTKETYTQEETALLHHLHTIVERTFDKAEVIQALQDLVSFVNAPDLPDVVRVGAHYKIAGVCLQIRCVAPDAEKNAWLQSAERNLKIVLSLDGEHGPAAKLLAIITDPQAAAEHALRDINESEGPVDMLKALNSLKKAIELGYQILSGQELVVARKALLLGSNLGNSLRLKNKMFDVATSYGGIEILYNFGLMYLKGEAVTRNIAYALELLFKSAGLGHSEAALVFTHPGNGQINPVLASRRTSDSTADTDLLVTAAWYFRNSGALNASPILRAGGAALRDSADGRLLHELEGQETEGAPNAHSPLYRSPSLHEGEGQESEGAPNAHAPLYRSLHHRSAVSPSIRPGSDKSESAAVATDSREEESPALQASLPNDETQAVSQGGASDSAEVESFDDSHEGASILNVAELESESNPDEDRDLAVRQFESFIEWVNKLPTFMQEALKSSHLYKAIMQWINSEGGADISLEVVDVEALGRQQYELDASMHFNEDQAESSKFDFSDFAKFPAGASLDLSTASGFPLLASSGLDLLLQPLPGEQQAVHA